MSEITVSIRPAQTVDAIGLAHVHVETWRDAYVGMIPDDYLVGLDEMHAAVRWTRRLSHLEEPERLSVAEVDSDIVGYCHGGPWRSQSLPVPVGDRSAEIYSLYVDPSFQGLGLGRALLGHVVSGMIDDGFDQLAIMTLAENRNGRRFYDALGGMVDRTIPSVVGGTPVEQVAYVWRDLSKLVRRIETANG